MANLLDLPPELLTLVAKLLDPVEDILSFRQVCRSVNNCTIFWFGSLFFKECSISLQRRSLEVLVEISRHALFRHSVTTLGISLAYVPDSPNLFDCRLQYRPEDEESDPEDEESDPEDEQSDPEAEVSLGGNDSDVEQEISVAENTAVDGDESNMGQEPSALEETEVKVDREAYQRYVKDQAHMRESGMDTAYLAQALAALPACRTIILHNSHYVLGAESQAQETGLWPDTDVWMFEGPAFRWKHFTSDIALGRR
ncbi:hypothetical protein DL767_007911 [Monosporascus sp. MG133]|nr:hypothetical protein DL767_007911 [Monosporascus sp. MG133]